MTEIILSYVGSRDWKQSWESDDFERAVKESKKIKGKICEIDVDECDFSILVVYKGINDMVLKEMCFTDSSICRFICEKEEIKAKSVIDLKKQMEKHFDEMEE